MDVIIEGLPDKVYERLKESAEYHRRTLNDQLILELEDVANDWERRRRLRETREALDRFRNSLPEMESSVPLIREDRDS